METQRERDTHTEIQGERETEIEKRDKEIGRKRSRHTTPKHIQRRES